MNITERKRSLINRLKDKEYRDAYVKASIDVDIPSQILALREQRDWTQEDLGTRADMKQEAISRIEDPEHASVTLKTLTRFAAAFDLALMVRFVPFSQLVNWKLNLSLKALEADSFDNDFFLNSEVGDKEYDIDKQHANVQRTDTTNNIIRVDFKERISDTDKTRTPIANTAYGGQ